MSSPFERRPKTTILVFTLALLIFVAGFAEIALRFIVPYDIGYYTAVRKEGLYDYPYGTVRINSDGFPDEEFDLDSPKKRIGYFGDSVTFGVGAGEGYRFSDLLQKDYPAYEHWTFSMLANGIQDADEIAGKAREYKLGTIVYAFNLNDILPRTQKQDGAAEQETPALVKLQQWVWRNLDGLRGKSYLYTSLRTSLKNALTRLGYSHTGFKAAELYPHEHEELIADVAGRIDDLAARLNAEGVTLCLLILPYEMQISEDAARTYHQLGIGWEDGFAEGSTQELLIRDLRLRRVYDGMTAFDKVKKTASVGEYFVYNKGDKIDFNHPSRAGHARLAQGFKASKSCPFL